MKNYIIYYIYAIKYIFQIRWAILRSKDGYRRSLHQAEWFAFKEHFKARQRYSNKPYYYHLKEVADRVTRFGKHLQPDDFRVAYIAALLHDMIEDLTFTYNDIKNTFGIEVAEAVFACTELRGKNRRERHGPLYYKGLVENRLGGFTKLCDFHANMSEGKATGSRMFEMYRKDYPYFKKKLDIYTAEFHDVFSSIETELMPS